MNQAIITVKEDDTRYTLDNVINVVYAGNTLVITAIDREGNPAVYSYSGDDVYITIC